MNQTPTPPAPPAGAVPASSTPAADEPVKNTIGLVALILAIVGFIFACIPGALILGWILLPVSFILAIVALAQKGKKKGTGVAALILAVVGTVVGIIVFVAVAADAISDGFEEASSTNRVETTVEEPATSEADEAGVDEPATEPADESVAEEPEPSGPAGTREAPLPFDAEIVSDDWTIAFTGFNPDGNTEVANGNMFNDEPADGMQWVILELEATYTGADEGNTIELSFAFVSADGTVSSTSDGLASGLDPEFDRLAELYEGGTEAGKLALMVPNSVDGLIRVTPSLFGDDVFVALP